MQSGSSDCGVAYVTAVAFGQDPGHGLFNQQQMRAHLHDCFLNGILTPFPHEESEATKVCTATAVHIAGSEAELFCAHCRQSLHL